MNERIILTLPRNVDLTHGASKWQFIADDSGFRAVEWFDVNALTNEQRRAYEADTEALPDLLDSHWTQAETPDAPPIWPSLDLALQYAMLCDLRDNLHGEIEQRHVPGECYSIANDPILFRLGELLHLAVLPATRNQTN